MKRMGCIAVALILLAGAVGAEEPWVKKKEKDGIQIFLRKVPGSGIKEFKGITVMKGVRLASFLAALDDTSSYTRWQHNCSEARLLKKIDLYKRYSYVVTKAPWPVWDRDSVIYSMVSQNPKTRVITVQMTGAPNYLPPEKAKKRIRMPKMRGTWTFAPNGKESVTVIYQLHSESGGTLPDNLANTAVVDIPFYTLQNLSRLVREPKFRDAIFKEVSEP